MSLIQQIIPLPVTVPNGGTGVATITGIVKGTGTTPFVAATAGTDYLTPTGSGTGLSGVALLASSNTFTNGTQRISSATGSTVTAGVTGNPVNQSGIFAMESTNGAGTKALGWMLFSAGYGGFTINPSLLVFDGTGGPLAGNLLFAATPSGINFYQSSGTQKAGIDSTGFYTGASGSPGRFSVTGGKTAAFSNSITIAGTDGKTLRVVSNGTFTLSVGAAIITDSAITANSQINITLKTVGGTISADPFIATITPASGFAVAGGGAANTSVYNYAVFEIQ